MLKNISIGQYFPGDSPLHRLDPRMKIMLTGAFMVLSFIATSAVSYALLCLFVLWTMKLSQLKMQFLLRALKPILFLVVLTFVFNALFTDGQTVWFRLGILRITKEGVIIAMLMALRLVLLVAGTQLMTLTTTPIDLTDGLERLMKPLSKIGFPAHELAMMMTIALRMIPTLLEETDKIMKAQTARGADFESGNLLKRARAMIPLLIPLFVSAFRRAEELALAMTARCYQGGEHRTRMKILHYSSLDLLSIGIMGLFAVAIIFTNRI